MVQVTPRPKVKYTMDGYVKTNMDSYISAVYKHNTSIVMGVDGKSGMGKSTFAIQLGTYCDPKFTLKNVHFDPDEFLIALSEAKKGDFLIFDEAMVFSSRSALSKINRMVVQAMSMIRSKNIFVVFCINSIFDLDRNLALHRLDILFHIYGASIVDRGNVGAYFKAVGDGFDRLKLLYINGKKFYDYSKPRYNYYAEFPEDFLVDLKEYNMRKDKAVDKFLSQSAPDSKKSDQTTENLVYHMRHTLKMKVKEIANIANLADRTIYNILARKKVK